MNNFINFIEIGITTVCFKFSCLLLRITNLFHKFGPLESNLNSKSYFLYILPNNEQVLHGLSFNIKIYLPEVADIQRHEAELNVISPRVNKFYIQ